MSQPVCGFAQNINDLHAEIRHKIALIDGSYKLLADIHRRAMNFEASDFVMAYIRRKPLPKTSLKKLHARAKEPYQII